MSLTSKEIKVLLLKDDLTVAGLAREFNCLRQELSMCIHRAAGRKYPHLEKLLAKKLKTNVDHLFGEQDQAKAA